MPKALEIFFSPRAEADIDQIYDYTQHEWGADQAEKYTLELKTVCQRLAEKPRPGRSASNLRSGYFILGCGSHTIFFREEKSRIVVVRILHNRMDFKRHL